MPKDTIILIHGYAAHPILMHRLKKILSKQNFHVINFKYQSTRKTIEYHAESLKNEIKRIDKSSTIHIIAHSMGGILVRQLLVTHKNLKFGRIIMIAPPNKGSKSASMLSSTVFKWSKTLRQISKENSYIKNLPEPEYFDIGIIASKFDRVVRIEDTILRTQSDHITLPYHHGELPWRTETAEQCIHFIKKGHFKRS
jgi:alpha-beta hydrolase superfamily lysophospholipase